MSAIFLSYRRDDASGYAGRLADDLRERFGAERVFMDIDAIEPGLDFVEVIVKEVQSCDVLLAVIGRQWITSVDDKGRKRLDDPKDYVRLEISEALKRKIRVVPILVQNASMPSPHDVPEELLALTRRNALEVTDARWKYDVRQLIEILEKIISAPPGPMPVPAPPPGQGGVAPELVPGAVPSGPPADRPRRRERASRRAAAIACGMITGAVVCWIALLALREKYVEWSWAFGAVCTVVVLAGAVAGAVTGRDPKAVVITLLCAFGSVVFIGGGSRFNPLVFMYAPLGALLGSIAYAVIRRYLATNQSRSIPSDQRSVHPGS